MPRTIIISLDTRPDFISLIEGLGVVFDSNVIKESISTYTSLVHVCGIKDGRECALETIVIADKRYCFYTSDGNPDTSGE